MPKKYQPYRWAVIEYSKKPMWAQIINIRVVSSLHWSTTQHFKMEKRCAIYQSVLWCHCFIMTNAIVLGTKNEITITTKKGHKLALCADDLKFCTLVPNTPLNNLRLGSSRSPHPHFFCGRRRHILWFFAYFPDFWDWEKFWAEKCLKNSNESLEIETQPIVSPPPQLWGK